MENPKTAWSVMWKCWWFEKYPGADSATHMCNYIYILSNFVLWERIALTNRATAEEIKDASIILPRSIMASLFLNGALGFVMLVTYCFCLGNVEEILGTHTGYPFIQVFYNVTNSHGGASAMTAILITLTVCGCISNVATASRQLFAFARDGGLPFSPFLAQVSFFFFFSYLLSPFSCLPAFLRCIQLKPNLACRRSNLGGTFLSMPSWYRSSTQSVSRWSISAQRLPSMRSHP